MITFVILNWRRRTNVDAILAALDGVKSITERIVWNNNPAVTYANAAAVVVNASRNFGFDARYAVAALARNDCLLFADDDLRLPPATIAALHAAWSSEPEIVHGLYPRVARADGAYARWLDEEPGYAGCRAIIIAGRVTMFSRSLLPAFFHARGLPVVTGLRQHFEARGLAPNNGDDLLMSYAAYWQSGQLNRGHKLQVVDLPAPHAGSAQANHEPFRDALMRELDAMTLERGLPLCPLPELSCV